MEQRVITQEELDAFMKSVRAEDEAIAKRMRPQPQHGRRTPKEGDATKQEPAPVPPTPTEAVLPE